MAASGIQHYLALEDSRFNADYDREPFGFRHALAGLDLFKPESIARLAARLDAHPEDYYLSRSAATPGERFFAVPSRADSPSSALAHMADGDARLLIKRPERHDERFHALLHALFEEVLRRRGGLRGERLLRLEGSLFISAGRTITPFHFDPEINFFAQIEGRKHYHLYPPAAVSDEELERFYVRGAVEIGQVALATRDPAQARHFVLDAGDGLHQPQNAPHWVETDAMRSLSYAFVYETTATRAASRARACNHYLRQLGFVPPSPGRHPRADRMKSALMTAVIPLRRSAGALLRKARGPVDTAGLKS